MPASRIKILFIYLIFIIFLAFFLIPTEAGEKELERILASYASLQSAKDDFQRQRLRGQMSRIEELDYRAFITRLRNQFHQDCGELAQVDIAALQEVPCPAEIPINIRATANDQQHERTRSEHTAILAGELDEALGEFDDMLLREQERVKAATPPSAASMASTEEQSGSMAGTTAATADGESGMTTSATAVTGSEEAASSAEVDGESLPDDQVGSHGQQRVSGTPDDIPDGSDDDVVARQLREAAEKETDPQLKKRLWEEYRKYKQGTR